MKWHEIASMDNSKIEELVGVREKVEDKEEVNSEENPNNNDKEAKSEDKEEKKQKKAQRVSNEGYYPQNQILGGGIRQEQEKDKEEDREEDREKDDVLEDESQEEEVNENKNGIFARIRSRREEKRQARKEFREEYIDTYGKEPSKFQIFIASNPILSKLFPSFIKESPKSGEAKVADQTGKNAKVGQDKVRIIPTQKEKVVAFKGRVANEAKTGNAVIIDFEAEKRARSSRDSISHTQENTVASHDNR